MKSAGSSRSSPTPQPGTWAFGSRNSGSWGRGEGCLHTEQCVAGEVSSDSGWETVGAAQASPWLGFPGGGGLGKSGLSHSSEIGQEAGMAQ